MIDTFRILATAVGWLVLFYGTITLATKWIMHLAWVRDGRPIFSKQDQLLIDLWRAQGMTLISARRKALVVRQSRFLNSIEVISDTQDLMTNPMREEELRSLAPNLAESILARGDDDPLKQSYIECYLEITDNEASRTLLEAIKRPELRAKITSVVGDQLRSKLPGL